MGKGAAGAGGGGCPEDVAERETAARGTRGGHGSTRKNNSFKISEKEWWRRGESNYSGLLITRKLLKTQDEQNCKTYQKAILGHAWGTRKNL